TLLIAHRRSTLQLADRIAVLDEGLLVDEGTHEELTERCALYRLLLAGPGDDAEGTDAGELDCYSSDAERRAADAAAGQAGTVTPSLWGPATASKPGAGAAGAGAAGASAAAGRGMSAGFGAAGRGQLRGGGAAARGSSMLADVPPTPELLAKVDALPPANDVPAVDQSWARSPDPHFTLRRLLRPFVAALTIGLVLDGLDALASIAMPALVRGGIDNGVLAKAFHVIVLIALLALGIVVADWVINVVQTKVVGRNGERLLYALRVKIFSQLQRLGLDYYERELSGRIMTRMTTDVDALSSFLQTGLITMVNSGLSFAGVLIALLFINVKLGLVLFSIIPVLVAVTVVFRAKSSKAYGEAREKVSVVNASLQENVAGLRVAQAYRREQVNADRFAGLSEAYLGARLRAQRYIALYFPFVQALSTVAGALVLFAAAGEVHSGALKAGGLIAYLLYIDLLFSPVQQLSQVFDGYQQAAVGLRRISALLRTRTSTPEAVVPIQPRSRLRGRIELRDVHFSYAGQRQEALTGINLTVAAGETVALVGQTGAGKSTLVKLWPG